MRLTIKQKQAINDRYPESHLVRVEDGWFLIARAGKEDSDGWPMGWYTRQVIDVEGPTAQRSLPSGRMQRPGGPLF